MRTAKSRGPVSSELLQRAADLVPVLQQRAAGAEQQRQLPQDTIEDLTRLGLLRVATPERFGGTGHEFNVVFDINMELGRGCASSAWCYAVWSAHNWMLGHWPEQAQQEY